MSLATRCAACGTAFRVVQDQLKVSEGWVRCGRCDAVFNALEGLFDLERAELNEQPPAPEPHASHAPTVDQAARLDDSPMSAPATLLPREAINAPDAQRAVSSAERACAAGESLSWSHAQASLAAASSPTPEFLRQPQPESQRSFDRRRFAIWIVGTVLLLVLAAQAAYHFRDSISAHWTSTKPTMVAWCKSAGCSVGVLRRISDVAVENSALTRSSGRDVFTLFVVLRNHGRMALALPSLELSLTDPNGQLLARRVLDPSDFRSALVIAAGAETALQITFASDSLRTLGYAVEIFYP